MGSASGFCGPDVADLGFCGFDAGREVLKSGDDLTPTMLQQSLHNK